MTPRSSTHQTPRTLAALRDQLDSLPPVPLGALAEEQTFFRLGSRTRLHTSRRCTSVPLSRRKDLQELSLTLATSTDQRCAGCGYRVDARVRWWEHRVATARGLRESVTTALSSLEEISSRDTPTPDQVEVLAEHASTISAAVEGVLAWAEEEAADEAARDLHAALTPLLQIAHSARSALTPLISHLSPALALRLRADVLWSQLDDGSWSSSMEPLVHTSGSEVLCAERLEDSRDREYPAVESEVLATALGHLVENGSFDGLDALLRTQVAEGVEEGLRDVAQLPRATTLSPAEFTRDGRLDLAAFAHAAWGAEVEAATQALVSTTLESLRARLARITGPRGLVLVALSTEASGRWDGVDVEEVLNRFPALAESDTARFHLVPGLVATWLRAVCDDEDEIALLGPMRAGESASVVATAASLLDPDHDVAESAPAALALARDALRVG